MTNDVEFWTRARDEAQLKLNDAQWEETRNKPRDITPIKVGDFVWCAHFNEKPRDACRCQGREVLVISPCDDKAGYSLLGSNTIYWHSTFYLRHIAERNRTYGEEETK